MGETQILKRLLHSVNEACRIKDKEILRLQNLNFVLESEKKQYVQMKKVQDRIIQNTVDKANALNNQYLEKIQELKRELRDGNSSKLGN